MGIAEEHQHGRCSMEEDILLGGNALASVSM